MAKTHTSKIEMTVELDENRVPENLFWTAQDGGVANEEAKAMMLSVWDQKNKKHFGLIYGQKTCQWMK
jgi:hypothetical protein